MLQMNDMPNEGPNRNVALEGTVTGSVGIVH